MPSLDDLTFTNDSLITVSALAEHFSIPRKKLTYAIKRGKLKAYLFGGQWHIRWGDFKRWQVTGMLGRRVPAIQCPACGAVFRKTKTHVSIIKTAPAPNSASEDVQA